MELEALMWTGRGDASFAQNLKYAYENRDAGTVDYIAEKSPALPDYIRAGLKASKPTRMPGCAHPLL
jgi:hypothetical protein